jgi:S-adenosylmethionine:tRNA ribosyltransferase-isomerase
LKNPEVGTGSPGVGGAGAQSQGIRSGDVPDQPAANAGAARLLVADFGFELPEERIARTPCEPRDAARLLVHDRRTDRTEHAQVRDLPRFLRAGDLLVVNDTRVLPHRLVGRRPGGGRVELLLLERSGSAAIAIVRPARKLRIGEPLQLEQDALRAIPREDLGGGRWRIELPGDDLEARLEAVGRAPLPPYLRRDDAADPVADRRWYQTMFARRPGAVAAPTAGLHFTPELVAALTAAGVELATVTLHVGEGTFAPIRVAEVDAHEMHEEAYELPAATAEAVERTRARHGRVVAVGTTSARVLETCATADRRVAAGHGRTRLYLYPGRPFRAVDALLTNFHLPGSTLLLLVAAFAGPVWRELYGEAIARGYRFYSYGDAMLLL